LESVVPGVDLKNLFVVEPNLVEHSETGDESKE
jgi:hypothetical protein